MARQAPPIARAEVDNFLGTVSANDFEEVVLNSFLLHLDRVIPVAASAVAISHRGQMRLVTRFPKGNNESFSSLLATRENLLQSVCLSDKAAVLQILLLRLSVDKGIMTNLVQLEEVGVNGEAGPIDRVRKRCGVCCTLVTPVSYPNHRKT